MEVRFVPDIYNFNLLHHSVTEIEGLPVINLTDSPLQGVNRVLKKLEDVIVSVMVIAVSFAADVPHRARRSRRRRPVRCFYRQERVTWNGDRFPMLKFRTMPVDAEASCRTGMVNAGREPRHTVRRFLRRI